jgi:eukaryotic-like serine/threonine-protein kinase
MTGRHLLHYEILDKLGEGGMGIVYKARDTHLDRFVAIKVLPAEKVADPERKRRFVQEAKAASALHHPNIITIHDIAETDGLDYIVMEHIDGKTLDALIPRTGMRLAEVLKIAMQIAGALAAAHAKGIVHRDLKPANVMVTPDGTVKILDFGLAKLAEPTSPSPDDETRTMKAPTEEGTILGTVAYMSPEQAEGKPIDARSDIFSFGALLYEMLTGRRAFQGDTKISTLSAVLHQEPKLLENVPHDLERVITRCLRKDPERRFQLIKDLRVELEELQEESDSGRLSEASVSASRKRLPFWLLILTAGLLLATAAGVIWWPARSPNPAPARVLTRLTSDSGVAIDPALSPDGKLLAYASDRAGEGNLDIWVRQVARGEPVRLTRDQADESEPTFSPDGTQIAFRSDREGGGIYVMPALGGGEPRLVVKEGRRPRFSPDAKWIAYWTGPNYDTTFPRSYKMFVVLVTGGAPRQLQAEFDLARFPTWSPDGKHLLFYGSRRSPGSGEEAYDWWVTPLDGGAVIRTEAFAALRGKGASWFDDPGVWDAGRSQLVFSASLGDRTNLWRVPIEPQSFRITGAPERLTYGVDTETRPSLATAASGTGVVFANMTWNVDLWSLPIDANLGKPTGQIERLTQDASPDLMPDLSPDGRKLVFVSTRSGKRDIWMRDLTNGRETTLTVTPAPVWLPVFSPDGSKVAYTVGELRGKVGAYSISSGGGMAEQLCDDCGVAYDWSRDGQWVVIRSQGQPRRLWLLNPASGQRRDLLQHPGYSFYGPQVSPDNRWLATYGRSGPSQGRLFVVPFRADGPLSSERDWVAITDESNTHMACRWSPDGNILYFTSRREGSTCIWAQRLDPATKHPLGDPWPVYHAHSQRLSLVLAGAIDVTLALPRAAGAARMVFPMGERTANIWMAELKERR